MHGDLITMLALQHGVEHMLEVAPPIAYRPALAEMLAADGLLLLQAANCSDQVPAKYYEYLRARRPLFALTNDDGDTARVMRRDGIAPAAPLNDAERIAAALARFVDEPAWRAALTASDATVAGASRAARSSRTCCVARSCNRRRCHNGRQSGRSRLMVCVVATSSRTALGRLSRQLGAGAPKDPPLGGGMARGAR